MRHFNKTLIGARAVSVGFVAPRSTRSTPNQVDSLHRGDNIVPPTSVQWLVVAAGGGGGGGGPGGGGGAGGYRSSVSGEPSGGGFPEEPRMTIVKGVIYTVVVGAAGAARTNGNNSSITGTNIISIVSTGGGRGGWTGNNPTSGGSGGAGGTGSQNSGTAGASGTVGQGFAGGEGRGDWGGGSGGSANQAGGPAETPAGVGVTSSITGLPVPRSVGGHGTYGASPNPGAGGDGWGSGLPQGGIVVIRYPVSFLPPVILTGGTQTTMNGFRIFTFNASGTIGW